MKSIALEEKIIKIATSWWELDMRHAAIRYKGNADALKAYVEFSLKSKDFVLISYV